MAQNDLEALEEEVGEEISKQELVSQMRDIHELLDDLFSVLDDALDRIDEEPSKLDQIIEQNKQMANGIIALSERLRSVEEAVDSSDTAEPKPNIQREPGIQQPSQEDQDDIPPPPGGQDDVPQPPQG